MSWPSEPPCHRGDTGAYALLAVVAGVALAPAVSRAAGPLRWVAAAVLLALAARTAVVALRPAGPPPAPGPRRAFVRLLGITLVDPLTVVAPPPSSPGPRGRRVRGGPAGLRGERLRRVGGLAAAARRLRDGRGQRPDRPAQPLGTALVSGAVMAVLAVGVLRP